MTHVATVGEKKQTVLGLYVTAKEAYDRWKADPENVKIADVRTPEEHAAPPRFRGPRERSGWTYELTPERLLRSKAR